jgi:hypothetical protein
MVSENKGNPFVDLVFFVLQEVISVNFTGFWKPTLTVKEGNMTTDLYSKPTDKHQYLSPSSCLPKHCFTSIPFSQAIRVKRICSTVKLPSIAKDLILLSCRLAMENLCVLQLESALVTLVTTWFTLATASPCSHLPSLFRENIRHCSSSLERNWKKLNAGQVVSWTTRCSVPATYFCVHSFFCWMVGHFLLRIATCRSESRR